MRPRAKTWCTSGSSAFLDGNRSSRTGNHDGATPKGAIVIFGSIYWCARYDSNVGHSNALAYGPAATGQQGRDRPAETVSEVITVGKSCYASSSESQIDISSYLPQFLSRCHVLLSALDIAGSGKEVVSHRLILGVRAPQPYVCVFPCQIQRNTSEQ